MTRSAPTRELHSGDLICGDCGEGNPPSRRFCSRCGASLVTAEKVHIPWWRRIFRRRRQAAVLATGAGAGAGGAAAAAARRGKRGFLPRLVSTVRLVVAVALLVGGIVYATFAPLRTWTNQQVGGAKTRVVSMVRPQYTAVHPVQVTGTGALPGHPPSALSDGFTNTYWAAEVGSDAIVTIRFQQPVDVSRALIRIGVSGNFLATNRPHQLHLAFSTGKSQDINLDDTADPQEMTIKPGGKVTTIQMQVVSVYKAPSGTTMAITEIEWFSRK